MKVAVVGSRIYPQEKYAREVIRAIIKKYPDTEIVSGGARGPDSWAVEEAEQAGIPTKVFYPQIASGRPKWEYKKAAFDRNTEIVVYSDKVVAFHTEDATTQGTFDSCMKAIVRSKPLYIYNKYGGLISDLDDIEEYMTNCGYYLK